MSTFLYCETEPKLRVNQSKTEFLCLIVPHVWSIAIKLIKANSFYYVCGDSYIEADLQQVSHLLEEGLIEPNSSPWRAQSVIVRDEFDRHKKACV